MSALSEYTRDVPLLFLQSEAMAAANQSYLAVAVVRCCRKGGGAALQEAGVKGHRDEEDVWSSMFLCSAANKNTI